MAKTKMLWRFEVNDPQRFTEWRPLWEFPDKELPASQELKDELNRINSPVRLRIVNLPEAQAR
jgi:hypothetical protein